MLPELRYALRGLRRDPGFTAAAVLTLALGIGATTAIFSVVYGVLIRPLPFPNQDRLVRILQLLPLREGQSEEARAGLTPDQISEWRATSRTLTNIGYYGGLAADLTGVSKPVRMNGARVSITLFGAVGVAPLLGRTFVEQEEQPGSQRVVILAYRTWVNRFGADPTVVEQTIRLNDQSYRVIGVMGEGFGFPSVANPLMSLDSGGGLDGTPEFWVPIVARPRPAGPVTSGGMTLVTTFALLREGVTIEQATAEANTLMPARAESRYQVELIDIRQVEAREARDVLLVFQFAVVLVLGVAWVNVVNLLLARAAARHHEFGIRQALGASRWQLMRQATAESIVLSLGGGVAGCILAYQVAVAVRSLPPYVLPRVNEIQIDAPILLFACAISIASGLSVGLLTALRIARSGSSSAISAGSETLRVATSPRRPSYALVTAEVAAATTLAVGSVLLTSSLVTLGRVDTGLESRGVLTFGLSLPDSRYPTSSAQESFLDELVESIATLPDVESVAATDGQLQSYAIGFSLGLEGRPAAEAVVRFRPVTPGFFRALGIPLRRGREFTTADRGTIAQTVIANEAFARQHFGTLDIVGRRIQFQEWPLLEIIGVAGDARLVVNEAAQPELYLPQDEEYGISNPIMIVRTRRDSPTLVAPAVREIVRRLDGQLALRDVQPLGQLMDRTFVTPRLNAFLAMSLGAIAVGLAGVGLYGLLAFSVGARTREIGIRMALGADSGAVIWAVIQRGLAATALGVLAGLGAAAVLSRGLAALLFETPPLDPVSFLSGAIVLLLVAVVASFIPARLATRVEPVVALRCE